jgi:hypothetical protein
MLRAARRKRSLYHIWADVADTKAKREGVLIQSAALAFRPAFADPSRRSGQALMVGATRKLGNDWLLDFRFSNFDFPVAFDDFLDPPASGEFLI